MEYKITKKQYTRVVNGLINTFFKGVKPEPSHESIDLYDGDEEIGWIVFKTNAIISKKCEYELIIFTSTLNRMKQFAPLFRKKLFAKLLINHFSKLSGVDIDCFWIDEKGNSKDEYAFKYKVKKKKK